jgi:predicted DNA-binding WGR domain protein
MSAITLHRSDPTKNLHRYYRLDVPPDLFGAWCFIREWGRIGQHGGQCRSTPFPTSAEAQAALGDQCRAKQRKGYAINVSLEDRCDNFVIAQAFWLSYTPTLREPENPLANQFCADSSRFHDPRRLF